MGEFGYSLIVRFLFQLPIIFLCGLFLYFIIGLAIKNSLKETNDKLDEIIKKSDHSN